MSSSSNFSLPSFSFLEGDAPPDNLARITRLICESGIGVMRVEDQAIQDDLEGMKRRERLVEITDIVPRGPQMRHIRMQRRVADFVKWHRVPNGIMNRAFAGKERSRTDFVQRIKLYMDICVTKSAKIKPNLGDETLPVEERYKRWPDGKIIYMSVSSLDSLTTEMMWLLDRFPRLAFTAKEMVAAQASIRSHVQGITMSFPVRSHIYRKTALFPRDLIKMLEWVFDNCGDKYDEALQFAVINTLFMYAGLRPGSVLATKHYPTKFAKWGDVEFRLRPGKDGKNTDIEVIFLVNTWKGYWLDDSKRVSFKIKPVQTLKFAYLDFGTYLLAFALARGVLGDRTFEDLLAAPDVVIRAEEEFRLLPIFVTGSRTRLHDLQTAKPLVSDLVNLRLKEVLRGVGVVTPESGRGDTLYAYRRTFATLISRRMSLDAARFFMGHSPNSTAIEKYYDFGNFQANVVGGILGEGEGGADEIIPLTALARPNNEKNYTVKDALRDSPRFRNMHEKWSFLRDCLASGSGDWTKVEPFKSDPAIQTSGHIGMLPAIIAAYKSQMRAFVVSLRKQQWASDAEKNEVEMEAAQFARLQRPVSEEETGEEVSRSSLLHSLQQALWEKERAFVREAINHDTDQTYEISPDSGLELAEGDDIENDDKSNAGDDEGLDLEQGGAEDVERVVDGEDGGESEWEDVEEGMDGDDAKEGVEKEGEGDVEAVEQVVQPLELKDCQTTKLELLRTLVQLCANQADSKNPQPCEECLDDPLVPDEQAPLFRPGEKLKRHLIQFHSPHLRCDRWLKSLIDEDGAYVCPLQVEASEHSSVAGSEAEGQRDLICGKSLKNEKHFRKHLFDLHQNQLHPDFLRPLNPSTRNASRSDANKKHEEITNRPRDRKVGVKRGPMYDFGTPGMFQHQDHTELGELGLGDSLFETGDIAPVKEWGFMLDEEGLLKL